MSSPSICTSDKSIMFRNVMCLAPMVRAGSLPFRVLCLKYGADLVYSEEIIDKRLVKCIRVENKELNTVDFVTSDNNCTLFRTAQIERRKVVFQMGTADAQTALQAARVVQNDVSAIDINMGCPKKFSLQGGMGAALLKDAPRATEIIRTLATALHPLPVTAKIRLLDSTEDTITFMRALEEAGAAAITVHVRSPRTPSSAPALWDVLPALVAAVGIPVLANGDVYTRGDMQKLMRESGVSGVMLGRPALLNPSLFRRSDDNRDGDALSVATLPIREVITAYLVECTRYAPQTVVVKYTIQEMMSLRRHSSDHLKRLTSLGVDYGRLHPEFLQISEAKSVAAMCEVFGVTCGNNMANNRHMAKGCEENTEHRFDDSYFKEDLAEAVAGDTYTVAKHTSSSEDGTQAEKRVKIEKKNS